MLSLTYGASCPLAGRLVDYATHRLAAGAARASVNYELACLRRTLRLAVKRGLLATIPVFDLPKVHNTRSSFFSAGGLAALLLGLSPAQAMCSGMWRHKAPD